MLFLCLKNKARVSQQFWPNMAKVANQHIDWPWSQLDLDLLHRNCSLDGMISASRCALVLLTKLVGVGTSQTISRARPFSEPDFSQARLFRSQTFYRAKIFTSQAFHKPEICCQISVMIKKNEKISTAYEVSRCWNEPDFSRTRPFHKPGFSRARNKLSN